MAAGVPDTHLPLGVGSIDGDPPMPLCLTDNRVIRLGGLAEPGGPDLPSGVLDTQALNSPTLDPILAAGPEAWAALRSCLLELVNDSSNADHLDKAAVPINRVEMTLPFTVADYVDFYSSLHHATNVGRIFRPQAEPLLPNWRHLPVGYHGRSASIAVSGSRVHRPCGLRLVDGIPRFGPSLALDFELEVGFVVGVGNEGAPIPTSDFADHVFGLCLVNDWSARDIQSFEYQPLGPFLGKSFHTSISPWITPLAALDDFRVPSPGSGEEPAGYLRSRDPWGFDLQLEVGIETLKMRELGIAPMTMSRTSFADMAWTPDQQLAHLTVNGSRVRTGDFYASGTVSGPTPGQEGSLLERTRGGLDPVELPDGTVRTYLLDGDRVTLSGRAPANPADHHANEPGSLQLGSVWGVVVPPRPGSAPTVRTTPDQGGN